MASPLPFYGVPGPMQRRLGAVVLVGQAPVILFGVIFFWTPPHFWALAIKYKDDYAAADVPMLPAVAEARTTCDQILAYTRGFADRYGLRKRVRTGVAVEEVTRLDDGADGFPAGRSPPPTANAAPTAPSSAPPSRRGHRCLVVGQVETNSSACTLFDHVSNVVVQHLADQVRDPARAGRFKAMIESDGRALDGGLHLIDTPRHCGYIDSHTFRKRLATVCAEMGWQPLTPGMFAHLHR